MLSKIARRSPEKMLLTRPVQGPLPNREKANDKAADRKVRGFLLHNISWGGFQNYKSAGWPHIALHRFLQPLSVLAAYGTFKVLSL